MRSYISCDPWAIIEDSFDPARQMASESLFSIGNGHMGQRANFEEAYSGKTLQGSYVAGIYYPDPTRVGWWKNGYPAYFAKVLNAPNWIGLDLIINGQQLDLAKVQVTAFRRVLDMQHGTLRRTFAVTMADGTRLRVDATRFVSLAAPETGAIRYAVTAMDPVRMDFSAFLDGDVRNLDSNYEEMFWNVRKTSAAPGAGFLLAETRKLGFQVACAMRCNMALSAGTVIPGSSHTDMRATASWQLDLPAGATATCTKYVAVTSSLDHDKAELKAATLRAAGAAQETGFKTLLAAHKAAWAEIWDHADVRIEGDVAAQQGIRFNIFQLNQTYTGADARLNIGPKGFTGEKYGGGTYWDTEAFCIPFFVATAPAKVTRNLLLYRYRQLGKAIENAEKLGFSGGAALFPMVTMNGEECHNEWEITFEEIHRNGAIAYAIYNYVRHTGDEDYLKDYGLEVLIGIARFWAQRVSFSEPKGQYVILGVTGPNEYENNVNNNWYTNTLAVWCLCYAADMLEKLQQEDADAAEAIRAKTALQADEIPQWRAIAGNMYFPRDEKSGLFLQQDDYLDKVSMRTEDIPPAERPINQHWSWDRILRSPFIKQADLLQGVYLFGERFDTEFVRRHFAYYEARTVHESSLSACIHAILAARIGDIDKAYSLYLRTARLDLDDYNHEVDAGLHITSMAGSWMAVVEGFGGKHIHDGQLCLSPVLPQGWRACAFRLMFRDQPMHVRVTEGGAEILWEGKEDLITEVYGKPVRLVPGESRHIPRQTYAHVIHANM